MLRIRSHAVEQAEDAFYFPRVGIGTDEVPHAGVGAGMFAIDGANESLDGPHIQITTVTDDYPLIQLLNYTHDNICWLFDAYYDGGFRSSDPGSNYMLRKISDTLIFQSAYGVDAGDNITFKDRLTFMSDGVVWNNGGLDLDHRIEAVGQTHALFIQGSEGNIGFGTVPAAPFHFYRDAAALPLAIFQATSHMSVLIKAPDGMQKTVGFYEDGAMRWQHGMDNAPDADAYIISQLNNPATPEFIIKTSRSVGFGVATPDGYVHIHKASAGAVTADVNSVLTLESAGWTHLSLLAPSTHGSYILFGDQADNDVGAIWYQHSDNTLRFRADTLTRLVIKKGSTATARHAIIDIDAFSVIGITGTDHMKISAASTSKDIIFGFGGTTYRARFRNTVFGPNVAAGSSLGDATFYWNDVSYKTLTDRGCLGWYDDQDDLALIQAIRPHKKLKTPMGRPRLDYATLPADVYRPVDIAKKTVRDQVTGKLIHRKGAKMGEDGAEISTLISIMLGAIKQLDNRSFELDARLAELEI